MALQATDFQGFFTSKPSSYGVLVDRELPDLPPVRCGDPVNGAVALTVAGQPLVASVSVAYAARDDIEHARVRSIKVAAPGRSGPHEREVIIKEVVKIPCKYCGNLNLQADKKCSACGANLG